MTEKEYKMLGLKTDYDLFKKLYIGRYGLMAEGGVNEGQWTGIIVNLFKDLECCIDNLAKQSEQVWREDLTKVNRVEVIDSKGRSYVNWNDGNKVDVQFQDQGRTMKIFIDLMPANPNQDAGEAK